MLAREDLTSDAFMGFFFTEVASIMMAIVMFRGKIFSKLTALAGILGSGLMLVFNICAAFVPVRYYAMAIIIAMSAARLIIAWYILMAQRLFQLGRLERETPPQQS